MRRIARWIATAGLGALAIYCTFALLFTAGGRDLGGAGSALLMWFGSAGSAYAVLFLIQKKPSGRVAGIAVYSIGAVYFLIAAAVSKLGASDRAFLVAIAAANALGVLALYEREHRKSAAGR
jgi:hypothetical protein